MSEPGQKYPHMPKISPGGLPVSSINSEHINIYIYTHIYTLSGQKYFNTFKLCHMVEICMPLKLFVLKITSNVLIYLIIG